jgi:Domain of unknown function (DUF4259)
VTESVFVGAWDSGPFDNDDAADFAAELDDADPNERLVLIREALQSAIDPADEDEEEAAQPRAVAAAAVLAAGRIDPVPLDSSYAPKFLATGEPMDVPDDLLELAVLALDRIAESDTEWAELFGEGGTLDTLRDALTA